MTAWAYKIPTLKDAPAGLIDKALYSEAADAPRIGLYCEESSHEGKPWFICSFIPNYAYVEAGGEFRWTPSNNYRTGTGDLLRIAYVNQQLLSDDNELAPVDAAGNTFTGGKWQQGRGRWNFECKACSNKVTLRSESFQTAVSALATAGIVEVSLDGLRMMVSRFNRK